MKYQRQLNVEKSSRGSVAADSGDRRELFGRRGVRYSLSGL